MSQSSTNTNNKNESAREHPNSDVTSEPAPNHQDARSCPKCGATKVAKSRSQSFDSLIMRFIPRRPYRCMRCYHRFWYREKFMADPRRAKSWALLLVVIVLLLAFKSSLLSDTQSKNTNQAGYPVVESTPAANTGSILRGDTTIVGAIEKLPGQGKSASNLLSSDDKRDLIINSAFNEAMPASAVNAQFDISSEELKRRLAEAKTRVRTAEKLSKIKAENLAAEVTDNPEEFRSLARIDINYRIEKWRQAWQSGDIESYLDFYAPDFSPRSGLSRQAWEESRRARVSPKRKIKLELSNFAVDFAADNLSSKVTFDQGYRSTNYFDESRKQLVVKKLGDQWYIVSEEQVK